MTPFDAAMLPLPINASVAPSPTTVAPLNIFVPLKASVPPLTLRPPVPLTEPANMPPALLRVRF